MSEDLPKSSQTLRREIAARPDVVRADGTGYMCVDRPITCVMTRFELRSVFYLPLFLWNFRKVQRDAVRVPGLLRAVCLVESSRVCHTVSLWTDENAILAFNQLVIHINAANWAMRYVHRPQSRTVGVFSAQWKLFAVGHNLSWGDLDLWPLIFDTRGTLAGQSHVSLQ